MPRVANVSGRLQAEQDWANELSALKAPADIRARIAEDGRTHGGVSSVRLGEWLGVRADVLRAQLRREGKTSQWIAKIPEASAYTLLKGYLPRVLGWQTVADFAKQLGIHRNTVESIVVQSGRSRALRYCLDQKIYISPSGEEFVRQRQEALKGLDSCELLTDFAKRTRVRPNRVTAFFSARKIDLQRDIRGRVRLSPDQAELFLKWRKGVLERRRHKDQVIEGVPFRSIVKLAEEKAALLAQPGTAQSRRVFQRELGRIRYIARQGGFGVKTEDGTFIPADKAAGLLQFVSIGDAARLCGVSSRTIRSWALKDPSIVIPKVAGRRFWGVALEPLVALARSQYSQASALVGRSHEPVVVASLAIQKVANDLGASFDRVVRMLPLDAAAQAALRKRVGFIPRDVSQQIAAIVESAAQDNGDVQLTQGVVDAFVANAERLAIPARDLAALALSADVAAERFVASGSIPCDSYLQLLRLGSVGPRCFETAQIAPASNVAQLVGEWCEGVGFSLAGLCDIYRVSEDDKRNLVERSGFVSGGAARKLLRIACMSAEQFKIESATRQERCVAVLKNRADALGMERSQLLNLLPLQAKSIEVLQKGQARLAPDEFAVLFELTAASEINFLLKLEPTVCVYSCRQLSQLLQAALPRLKRPASEVYDFLRRTFYLGKNVPSDYASLLKRSDKEPVFVASVGVLLRWLGDPKQGVFVSKITKRPAEVGDIYVNLDTGDFGPITAIKSDETGRLAQVSLFIMKRSSDFRVV